MESAILCPLCSTPSDLYYQSRKKTFLRCCNCSGVFLHPAQRLSADAEKQRYQFHQNDVDDKGYQAYLQPLTDRVMANHLNSETCLDFGSGPSSVVAKLLRDKGFSMTVYDPYFFDDRKLLLNQYDFITCTEVMEHFYSPLESFTILFKMLVQNGKLYCTTRLYLPEIDFSSWFYKNDATHVFFYTPETVSFVSSKVGFSNFIIEDKLIVFEK
ncbi:MAG TPA: class I SAM-dependent methyltransferase [Bacteroidales bacterium]|nr:class I SAM-dependent methyltransferase [Bacteroidales bacterium]HQQ12400.1 class I SAM-dependent methyltransferase [Bacteroidales bacterium]